MKQKVSEHQAGLSRRQLGWMLAGSAALPFLNRPVLADEPSKMPAEAPPFGDTIEFKRRPAPKRISPFSLEQVRITGGPLQEAQALNLAYIKRLDVDRLLHNFRFNAGLPSTATPLGGWEAPDCELRGHFVGHLLSACALMHASTGDKEIKVKGDLLVAGLAECSNKLGGGYLSAFPVAYFERLKTHQKIWAPFYTYHKILAGMIEMSQLAGNAQALTVAEGMARWAGNWSSTLTEPQMQQVLNVEYGGMNEALYNLAFITGKDEYAITGDRFTKKRFFNPLALRRDELRGLHVNTHIPQVIGAARRYELSSDERFHDVADFFWYEVTSARAYVTGGTSNGELWRVAPRRLGEELKLESATTECCCAYNMLKLTRTLYEWSADPRYFDYYERVLFNHRLGTIEPGTGHTQYYLSIVPAAWKTFNTENDSFWCCTGTGVEEYSKLNDSIYFHDNEGVYVNLFIPSALDWRDRGIKIRQETDFPQGPATSLLINTAKPTAMPMYLRIPAWVAGAPTLKVNGHAADVSARGGSYLVVHRTWHDGDRIELTLPMNLHVEAMPDEPQTQAFLYGPLVLAGDLGTQGLKPGMISGKEGPDVEHATALPTPSLRAAGQTPETWIKPGDKPLTFNTVGQDREITFAPFYQMFGTRYSIYWTVT